MWSPRWSTDPSRSVDGNGQLPWVEPRKTRIGLFAGGLGAYWPQFPDLLPELQASARRVSERFSELDCEVIDVAYYHRGLDGETHERVAAGMILGASLLTARGFPAAGEYQLRTSLAMGVDGRIRFLRNVMGWWILQECLRIWDTADLPGLLADAAAAPAFGVLIDPDDPSFLAPGNIQRRIEDFCAKSGPEAPRTRTAVVRCVLESLALAYRRMLRLAQTVADREIDVVHVIGSGSQNELLCQLTADACGLPVLAGPVEASTLGNVLVQARALGAPLPDLTAMRALVRATHELRRYEPQGKPADWDAAESRVFGGSR
jgi:hypothetical protein